METTYLIIGASHAGLSAMDAIRRCDRDNSITLVSAEKDYLYSPTALPYVISGKTRAGDTALRSWGAFQDLDVTVIKGAVATGADTAAGQVTVSNGTTVQYDKLLIATGAAPAVPPIQGIDTVDACVVRTMADAEQIRDKTATAKSAVIIGAGFIGMHAAENLANAGLTVTVVETLDRIMPASFDADASQCIRQVFADRGITILTGRQVNRAGQAADKITLTLDDGKEISADMLVMAAGIRPNTDFLADTPLAGENGIPVDHRMRTSLPGIWAAGDVALAPGFFSGDRHIGGTIPTATEQGRTAGMDMAEDAYVSDYPGNLNMNTFNFFGNFAFSIGNVARQDKGSDIVTGDDPDRNAFWKFVFQKDVLTGVSAVNMRMDPGILKRLILDRADLGASREALVRSPLETGRLLMRDLF